MFQQRTVRLECGKATHVLHVLGTQLNVKLYRCAPPGSQYFQVKCTNAVQYQISPKVPSTSNNVLPLEKSLSLSIAVMTPSKDGSDNKVTVLYFGDNLETVGKAILHLTAVELSLDVDADRDGVVEKNNPHKGSWKWGPNGHGAIVLVNCDMESLGSTKRDCDDDSVSRLSDLKDMSRMVLRTNGPGHLPPGYKLLLHISLSDADKIGVFQAGKSMFNKSYPVVLGRKTLSYVVKYEGGTAETEFFVEGRRFLDEKFEGLVTIYLSLLEPSTKGFPETPIFTDKVVFHMAPWIMTPNTLRPVQVFVCSTPDNYSFLKGMTDLVKQSGCKLKVCHEYMNRGDRWMQDELEFGYVEAPHQRFPVVLDSPRDGKLKDFPYKELLGPDFGYVTRVAFNETVTSLDSFGNLEVSPPVTVNGKEYPLGRIIIGCAFPTTVKGRNMTKVVQDFLWAQKVQAPIAVFSDWLFVGHVDEFMTFIPAPNRKGFRLLLASPDAAYTFFRGLQKKGHGKAKMFEGLKDEEVTVDQILSRKQFQQENAFVQSCIDWNRDVLKKELGLEEEDIIDLPILFSLRPDKRAVAYYPDMVNMIVLGKNLGIPKPYGPKINGVCALEKEVCSLLGGLGLNIFFIDDFASYHKLLGEVHCGSNVQREPFSYKWWNMAL
ncbi:protein-arginine deiminase type-2-like [Polyodon spathula]|uniref:protein-arginine deiminase type-2-like n=1 Tax=Polyodon spathula TaxID=7913 RepID=UPI001B7E3628|nr:protein-arginine deiminase type-2-like [Polyodon spathula]